MRNSLGAELSHRHLHAPMAGRTKGDGTKMHWRTTEITIKAGVKQQMMMRMRDQCVLLAEGGKPWQSSMILPKSDGGSFENITQEVI